MQNYGQISNSRPISYRLAQWVGWIAYQLQIQRVEVVGIAVREKEPWYYDTYSLSDLIVVVIPTAPLPTPVE